MDTCKKLQQLISQFPHADAQLKQLCKAICDIEKMARHTPISVAENQQWSSIVSMAEKSRQNFCKALTGKTMFSDLYYTYTVTLHELKAMLKASTPAANLRHRSPLPPRRMASKKSGYASGTAQMRPPRLQRKQCLPQCLSP
jgi:hypothetical protein